jgi:hypothetical protein
VCYPSHSIRLSFRSYRIVFHYSLIYKHTAHLHIPMTTECCKCGCSRTAAFVNMDCDWCMFEYTLFTETDIFKRDMPILLEHQRRRALATETVQNKLRLLNKVD